MRLLNSRTLEFEEYFDTRGLQYAILSHTWQDEEVTLQDMQNGTASQKKGYAKIKQCCELASKDDLYAWIDTCCIDKTSSAELTESINSMYRWYKNSVVCYAYLSDVDCTSISNDRSFAKSKWFTRGWTLQELIAPRKVKFYNSAWQILGDKEGLVHKISAITGIGEAMLTNPWFIPEDFSIAMRMSWASKRITTRVEDGAYSLLGLFGVNMPLLYGEGKQAFIRLQEEILKNSDDQSLFAWKLTDDTHSGLLAPSPAAFSTCSTIACSAPGSKWNRIPYSVTNLGLSIEMPVIPWAMDTYLAALDCEIQNVPSSRMGIFLKLSSEKDQYARVFVNGEDCRMFKSEWAATCEHRKIYVRQKVRTVSRPMDALYGFWIRTLPTKIVTTAPPNDNHPISEVTCYNTWNDKERILEMPTGSSGTAGIIWYRTESGYSALKLGFDISFNPIIQVGGPLFTPNSKYTAQERSTFAGKMNSDWMLHKSDWIFKGDRLLGLKEEQAPRGISITLKWILRYGRYKRAWVVDIVRMEIQDPLKRDFRCDGCGLAIYVTRQKCLVCPECQYCSKCILTASATHGTHEFQAVEAQYQLSE